MKIRGEVACFRGGRSDGIENGQLRVDPKDEFSVLCPIHVLEYQRTIIDANRIIDEVAGSRNRWNGAVSGTGCLDGLIPCFCTTWQMTDDLPEPHNQLSTKARLLLHPVDHLKLITINHSNGAVGCGIIQEFNKVIRVRIGIEIQEQGVFKACVHLGGGLQIPIHVDEFIGWKQVLKGTDVASDELLLTHGRSGDVVAVRPVNRPPVLNFIVGTGKNESHQPRVG